MLYLIYILLLLGVHFDLNTKFISIEYIYTDCAFVKQKEREIHTWNSFYTTFLAQLTSASPLGTLENKLGKIRECFM